MKKFIYLIFFIIISASYSTVLAENNNLETDIVYHVRVDGNDTSDGFTEETAFRTVSKAQQTVRDILKKKENKDKNITVLVHGGVYEFDKSIEFDIDDSGKEGIVTYKSADDGDVVFCGSVELDISKLKGIGDENIKSRLPYSSRNKVAVLDLKEQGLSENDVRITHERGTWGHPLGVYLNNNKQNVARWPNSGYKQFENVISRTPGGKGPTTFEYNDSVIDSWENADNAYIEGNMAYDWVSAWAKIDKIDTQKRQITVTETGAYSVPTVGKRWCMVNLLEAIDIPGEYFVDEKNMLLYYYPLYSLDKEKDKLEFATLREPFFKFNGTVKNIVIDGITFEKSYDTAIYANDVENFQLRNCIIRNISGHGINIKGKNITVDNCRIYNVGLCGVYIRRAGTLEDMEKLTESNVRISNCEINNISTESGSNETVGININAGIGVKIENNTLHGSKNGLIRYRGMMHTIRNNEIYAAVRSAADAGAIYAGRSLAQYGTIIEYNYFHDCEPINALDANFGTDAIFLDDGHSGNTVRNNIFRGGVAKRGIMIQIGSGRDNVVEDNTFINASYAVHGDDRAASYRSDDDGNMYKELTSTPYNTLPYLARFPQMEKAVQEWGKEKILYPHGTSIKNNLLVNSQSTIAKNYYTYGVVENNIETTDEDIFVDKDSQDYRVKKENVEKFNLNNIISEDFQINLIGVQTEKRKLGEFFRTYPQNGASDVAAQGFTISWQSLDGADEYDYIIAKDENLKDIVSSGKTELNSAEITGLENNTVYYWTVYAKSIGLNNEQTVSAYGDVYCFKTMEHDILDKSSLKRMIKTAKSAMENIHEGENIGEHKPGTEENLIQDIEKAEGVAQVSSGKQTEIDLATTELKNAYNSALSNYNIGYKTISTQNGNWLNNKGIAVESSKEEGVFIKDEILYSKELQDKFYILCFRAKNISEKGWFGFALQGSNEAKNSYDSGMDSYLIVVKPDVFELQGRSKLGNKTVMMKTVPNNGIFETQNEYEVKFGAVPEGQYTRIIFEVGENVVFNYLDKENPISANGYFAITPREGMYIWETDNVPQGKFEYESQEIKDDIIDDFSNVELVKSDGVSIENREIEISYDSAYHFKGDDGEYVLNFANNTVSLLKKSGNNETYLMIENDITYENLTLKVYSGQNGKKFIGRQGDKEIFGIYDPYPIKNIKVN